jgi:Fis family transcriptional regulator
MQDTIEKLAVDSNLTTNPQANQAATQSLRSCAENALKNYFSQLGDMPATNLYDFVLAEIEVPLLEVVLNQTKGNQTQAAQLLGISRGTLRKKLKQYHLE